MTYSLRVWQKPESEEIRIYIKGTTRKDVWFTKGKNGELLWSSKTSITPYKYQTGDHYGKIRKDRAAADEVAEAYGWKLGETSFDQAVKVAQDGIEIGE